MFDFLYSKWKKLIEWLDRDGYPCSMPEEGSFNILCVDDDPSFCLYIKKLCFLMNAGFTKTHSIELAKKLISSSPDLFSVYIFDGHLPDGTGMDLVAWMREVKKIDRPILFLSRVYQDADTYKVLKDKYKVDYVLDKPIDKNDFFEVIGKLSNRQVKKEPEQVLSEVMQELQQGYEKTIYDKLFVVQELIIKLQETGTLENMKKLQDELHKIGGSAGSYGYPLVSDLCKKKEQELAQQIELFPSENIKECLSELDGFYSALKKAFQN